MLVLKASAKIALVLVIGTVLGLSTTAWVLNHRIDIAAVRVGPWVVWPKAGTSEIDPYARAIYAQAGQIALASTEGLLLFADTDDVGAPLTGRCSYKIVGSSIQTRFWTLSTTSTAGNPFDNPAERYGFTSADILRSSNGSFAIEAASSVRPGNWLPISGEGNFSLSLRLYESPFGNTLTRLDRTSVPTIRKEGCR